jgi:hypothetical protein
MRNEMDVLSGPDWYDAQTYLAESKGRVLVRQRVLRHDTRGDPSSEIGRYVYVVVSAMVLVIIVAALFGPLNDALTDYADNETTFGPIMVTLVPILLGVGILLAFVTWFLPSARERLKGK